MSFKESPFRQRVSAFRPGPVALFALIWLAGALARLYGAWCVRHITDYDASVVGLMARHMAEGRSFPVFFYGQPYMGSLEPSVSAVLFVLFGESGFALTAGPALVSALALWAAMRWAKDVGGTQAAGAAGLLLAMGPMEFYAFQFAARGGYMTSMLFGLLVLWLGARMADDLRAGRPLPGWRYFTLGALGGLGWWSSQMVTSALLVCAAQVAVAARFRPRRLRIFPAAAGFLLGSLPFWWWNITHGFATFLMAGHLGSVSLGTGLRLLAHRYRQFLGALPEFTPFSAVLWLLYLVGIALGAAALAREFRRRQASPTALAAATAAGAHGALSLLIYITSDQIEMNTARFLVPMWPSLVLLILAGISWLAPARRRGLVLWSFALTAAIAQAVLLPSYARRAARVKSQRADDQAVADWINSSRVEALYAHLREYPLNFRLGGSVPVTNLQCERYPPFGETAERAERIGIIGDHGAIRSMLRHSGGSARLARVGSCSMAYDFRPPAGRLQELPPSAWSECTDRAGADLMASIADRNPDTSWTETAEVSEAEQVTVRFSEPQPLREIRIWPTDTLSLPALIQVEVQPADSDEWRVAHKVSTVSPFYWSGPRPFYDGRRAFWSCRMPDDPTIRAVRLTRMPHHRSNHIWRITELQMFSPRSGERPADSAEHLARLWDVLRERGHRRLYAGRWLSMCAYDAFEGNMAVELSSKVFHGAGGLDGGAVVWDAHTALVVEEEDLPQTLRALERSGRVARLLPIGPWILIDSDPADFSDAPPNPFPLWWNGRCLWNTTAAP
ncbi:MAG: hypothetical protein KBA51_08755 [Kiritimatiellae bacterium]|nr:hypothetical protein [Kiritimatiellia bacterium]